MNIPDGVQVGPTVLFVAAYLLRNTQDEDRKRLVVGLVIFTIAIKALDVYTNVGMWLRNNYNGSPCAMLVALASFSDKSALTLIWLALCFGVSWFEELIAAMANQTYKWFALAYYGFTGKKLSTKKQQQRQQQLQRQDEPPQPRPQRPQPPADHDIPPDPRAIFGRIDQG